MHKIRPGTCPYALAKAWKHPKTYGPPRRDCLAVSQDKGDVAAVTFEQTFNIDKPILPCSIAEKCYFEEMLQLIRKFDSAQKGLSTMRIVKIAAQRCIKKVRSRMKKVGHELAQCGVTMSGLKII